EKYFRNNFPQSNGQYGFSEPFFSSIYHFDEKYPTVLFVGQETNGWGAYAPSFGEEDIVKSQEYVREFLENNIDIRYTKELYGFNSFWNFIRDIYDRVGKRINVVWTELDKIHYSCEQKKCVRLWQEDREYLNGPLANNNKSILQLEIEIIKPDYIVFLTGPQLKYRKSMSVALGIEKILTQRPQSVHDVFVFSAYNAKCLWIYHPNARGFKIPEIAEKLAQKIKNRQ
ncbi:MAG: hypothetical protein J6X34_08265, partial [Clostridia bacterium]|nr:hypothetical protein [Clostridia bacterium]